MAKLVNDQDLTLAGPSGTVLPWVLSTIPHADSLRRPAQRGTDRRNNVEQITLADPLAGSYELLIAGQFLDPQPRQVLDPDRLQYLRWWKPDSSGTAVLRVGSVARPASDTVATLAPVVGAGTWDATGLQGRALAECRSERRSIVDFLKRKCQLSEVVDSSRPTSFPSGFNDKRRDSAEGGTRSPYITFSTS